MQVPFFFAVFRYFNPLLQTARKGNVIAVYFKIFIKIIPIYFIPFFLGAIAISVINKLSGSTGEKMHFSHFLPLSFALGSSALTLLLFYLSLSGFHLLKRDWVTPVFWALAIFYLILFRAKTLKFIKNATGLISFNRGPLIPAVLLILIWGITLLEPLALPLRDWDVLFQYAFKAKALFFYTAKDASSFFQDLSLAHIHLDYPLYLPFLYVWIYSIVGSVHEHWAVAFNPVAYGLLLVFFYNAVKENRNHANIAPLSPLPALFFTIILARIPFLHNENRMAIQRPCLYISLFYLMTVVHTWKWIRYKKDQDLYFGGLLCVLLGWIKLEGMMLGAVIFSLTLCFCKRKEVKKLLFSFGAWFLLVLPWYLFRVTIPKLHENYGERILEINILEFIPIFFETIINTRAIFSFDNWLVFWPVFFIFMLAGYKIFLLSNSIFLSLSISIPAFIFIFMFAVNPWWTPLELINLSANRLFFELAPTALYIIAVHHNLFFRISEKPGEKWLWKKKKDILAYTLLVIWASMSIISFFPMGRRYISNAEKYGVADPSVDITQKRKIISGDYYSIWKVIAELHGRNPSPLFVTSDFFEIEGLSDRDNPFIVMGAYFLYPTRVYISDPGKVYLGKDWGSMEYRSDEWLKSKNIFARVNFAGKYGETIFINYRNLMSSKTSITVLEFDKNKS